VLRDGFTFSGASFRRAETAGRIAHEHRLWGGRATILDEFPRVPEAPVMSGAQSTELSGLRG